MLSRKNLTIISVSALVVCLVSALIARALTETVTPAEPNAGIFSASLLISLLITAPAFIIFLGSAAIALIAHMQSAHHDKKNAPK